MLFIRVADIVSMAVVGLTDKLDVIIGLKGGHGKDGIDELEWFLCNDKYKLRRCRSIKLW